MNSKEDSEVAAARMPPTAVNHKLDLMREAADFMVNTATIYEGMSWTAEDDPMSDMYSRMAKSSKLHAEYLNIIASEMEGPDYDTASKIAAAVMGCRVLKGLTDDEAMELHGFIQEAVNAV